MLLSLEAGKEQPDERFTGVNPGVELLEAGRAWKGGLPRQLLSVPARGVVVT